MSGPAVNPQCVPLSVSKIGGACQQTVWLSPKGGGGEGLNGQGAWNAIGGQRGKALEEPGEDPQTLQLTSSLEQTPL